MTLSSTIKTCALAAVLTLGLSQGSRAAALTEVTGFGANPGQLQMFAYAPDGLAAQRPVVVVLHGCTSSAAAIDDEAGWRKWADQKGFLLVLPQQTSTNNTLGCFNWYQAEDQASGAGEPASIKSMIDWAVAHYSSNPARVYIAGTSAGGAMAMNMLAAYPQVFEAGAVNAGMAYKCADNVVVGLLCMKGLMIQTPQQWGDKVRAASNWTGPWPRVSFWHGSNDMAVAPTTQDWQVAQWTNVHGISQTPSVEDLVNTYPHKVYKNAAGLAVVESYLISGADHGEYVDPGTGAEQCGATNSYILDVNICASYYIVRWFGL